MGFITVSWPTNFYQQFSSPLQLQTSYDRHGADRSRRYPFAFCQLFGSSRFINHTVPGFAGNLQKHISNCSFPARTEESRRCYRRRNQQTTLSGHRSHKKPYPKPCKCRPYATNTSVSATGTRLPYRRVGTGNRGLRGRVSQTPVEFRACDYTIRLRLDPMLKLFIMSARDQVH